jgi:hypothetical protein
LTPQSAIIPLRDGYAHEAKVHPGCDADHKPSTNGLPTSIDGITRLSPIRRSSMSAPSSTKLPHLRIPDSVSSFLARLVLAGLAVMLLALTGHA